MAVSLRLSHSEVIHHNFCLQGVKARPAVLSLSWQPLAWVFHLRCRDGTMRTEPLRSQDRYQDLFVTWQSFGEFFFNSDWIITFTGTLALSHLSGWMQYCKTLKSLTYYSLRKKKSLWKFWTRSVLYLNLFRMIWIIILEDARKLT